MSGFLKTLQKTRVRPNLVAKGDGPLVDGASVLPDHSHGMNGHYAPSEELPSAQSIPLDESQPWWLTGQKKVSAQVDALIDAARGVVGRIDRTLIDRIQLQEFIHRAIEVSQERLSREHRFSTVEVEQATQELMNYAFGKGPLQPLYEDPAVTDIYIDSFKSIKCLRRGQALDTPFRFRSETEYEDFLESHLLTVGAILDSQHPIVECVLKDSHRTRVSAVHASLRDESQSGAVLRIPRLQQVSFYDLLRSKTLPSSLASWLAELVNIGEANVLVVGATGAGKTTMTTALLSTVSSDERICTIEDVPEVFIPTLNVEKLLTRPPGSNGEDAVTLEQLLRAVLRRAPHRIVVGEIRDREAPLFLRALETGHSGSVATLHAANAHQALWRLLDIVMTYENAPLESILRRISRTIHLIVTMKKIQGKPCLWSVSEVQEPVQGDFQVRDLIRFEEGPDHTRRWRMVHEHSHWIDRLSEGGIDLLYGHNLLPPVDLEGQNGREERLGDR